MSSSSKNNNQAENLTGREQSTQVVEAEVIDNNEQADYGQRLFQKKSVAFEVHGRGWQQQRVFEQASQGFSCLPILITLILIVSMALQAGFLASIGFVFFYILGSFLSLFVSVRRTLQGKIVYAWLNRVLVWTLAYALTLGLAQ